MDATAHFRRKWRACSQKAWISVHRGLWGPAPENSLAAIAAAEPLGIVEIDIQLAADGVPVVFHDDTLDRMTATTGRLVDQPSSDLASLALRSGAGGDEAELTAQAIPLLDDVIASARPGSWFDFDVKKPSELDPVAAHIARAGAQMFGSVKIDTQTPDDIANLLDIQARHGVMIMAKVILQHAGLEHIADLARAGVAAVELLFDDLAELDEACRIAGPDMAVTTLTLDPVHNCGLCDSIAADDPDKVWGRLLDAGASILMTDRADDLAAYMRTRR